MVLVHNDRGHNVGFVDREVALEDYYKIHQEPNLAPNQRPKKILSFLLDDDESIRKMLQSKISAENYTLKQCQVHTKGRKLSVCADIISTEFQFDRKKLTIYIKKYDDVSVCRLVRKLYESFKMRVKVLEVESAKILHDLAWKYFEVSRLNIPFNEIFTFNLNSRTIPFLNTEPNRPLENNPLQTANVKIYSQLFKNPIQSQPLSASSREFIPASMNSTPTIPIAPTIPVVSTRPIMPEQHYSSYPSQHLEVKMRDPLPSQMNSNVHNNNNNINNNQPTFPESLYSDSYYPTII